MIEERKKIEFWNFLIAEKNQPRPKGITTQRLSVIKPAIISADELWLDVIERHGAGNRGAAEFYQSKDPASVLSRAAFWEAVRGIILEQENKRNERNKSFKPDHYDRRKTASRKNRRK